MHSNVSLGYSTRHFANCLELTKSKNWIWDLFHRRAIRDVSVEAEAEGLYHNKVAFA